MQRPLRLAAVVVLLAVAALAALAGLHLVRNPERATLDAAARRAAPGRFVRLADGVTHYEVAGPAGGAPVALVHGFSVPGYVWDSTFAALAGAGFRVLRYDEYGRGWSDRPDVTYDAALYHRQLGALLDSAGLRGPVHLVGLSMGGWVTASFAGAHPGRVRSLTLVDPVAARRGDVPPLMRTPLLGAVLWQTLAVPDMAAGQLGDFVDPSRFPDWVERYRVQMRYRGFGRALRSTIRAAAATDLAAVYGRVGRDTTPVLLVWGVEDRTVPFALSDSVRRWIPRAEFVPVAGAGHLPQLEKAGEVNAALVAFFRAHGGGAAAGPDAARGASRQSPR